MTPPGGPIGLTDTPELASEMFAGPNVGAATNAYRSLGYVVAAPWRTVGLYPGYRASALAAASWKARRTPLPSLLAKLERCTIRR